MLKRILSVFVAVTVLSLSGLFLGCDEDEIHIHEETQVETTTQEEVVVP